MEESIDERVAFERLYRRTVARVHSLARRLLGSGEADEATQEVMEEIRYRRDEAPLQPGAR